MNLKLTALMASLKSMGAFWSDLSSDERGTDPKGMIPMFSDTTGETLGSEEFQTCFGDSDT